MAGRVFVTPPMMIDTTALLAEHGFRSNAAFGSMFRKMIAEWVSAKGRWKRRGSLPEAQRLRVFKRDGHKCQYCGNTEGPHEIDHVTPVAAGGSDEDENLCVSCKSCNREKGAKSVSEWRRR